MRRKGAPSITLTIDGWAERSPTGKRFQKSIKRLDLLDEELTEGAAGLTKKERLGMEREQAKLQASLGGIRKMGGVPDILFVIDVKKEALAVAEAKKLGIPIVAVVDTNCSPEGVTYMIPGNDDASRAITLYCDLVARAALEGTATQMGAAGVDIGEFAETLGEKPEGAEQREVEAAEADEDPLQSQESQPAEGQTPAESVEQGESLEASPKQGEDSAAEDPQQSQESLPSEGDTSTDDSKQDENLEASTGQDGDSAEEANAESENSELPGETEDTDASSDEETTGQESESKSKGKK